MKTLDKVLEGWGEIEWRAMNGDFTEGYGEVMIQLKSPQSRAFEGLARGELLLLNGKIRVFVGEMFWAPENTYKGGCFVLRGLIPGEGIGKVAEQVFRGLVEPNLRGCLGLPGGTDAPAPIRVSLDLVSRPWPVVWVASEPAFRRLANRINVMSWSKWQATARGLKVSVVPGNVHIKELEKAKASMSGPKTGRRRVLVKAPRGSRFTQNFLLDAMRGYNGQVIAVEHFWRGWITDKGHTDTWNGSAYVSLGEPDAPRFKVAMRPLEVMFAFPPGARVRPYERMEWARIPQEMESGAIS
jgi:hypothetical protein